MSINEHGFLGKDIKHYENSLEKKYKEVFNFYEEFNYFLHTVKLENKLKNNDLQGGVITGIFFKSLSTFQAIYILFKHHLCNNVESLTRILFEEMVNIAYCSLGLDEARRYLSLSAINKLKLINMIYKEENRKYFFEGYKEKAFKRKSYNEQKSKLMSFLHGLGVKEIFSEKGNPKVTKLIDRIKELNSKSIMHYYLTFYNIVSAGVHSSPDILERYLIFDEKGLIKELHRDLAAEKCEITSIFVAIHFMIICLEYIHDYFKYPPMEDILKFGKRAGELGAKYKFFFRDIE